MNSQRFIKRSELGRKMTADESSLHFFWQNNFKFKENFLSEDMQELSEFKIETLKRLKP